MEQKHGPNPVEQPAVLPSHSGDPVHGCSVNELLKTGGCRHTSAELTDSLAVNVFTLPEALIIGERYPLVFSSTPVASRAVWESHLIRPNFDFDLPAVLDTAEKETAVKRIDFPVLFLAAPGADNFYHWMHDCLPRLFAAERAGVDVPLLVPAASDRNKFIRESLSLLNIPESKIIEFDGGKILAPEVILVEDLFYRKPDQIHHHLLKEVRERLLSAVKVAVAGGEKIFLSREGDRVTRGLINQNAVESFLIENGFRKVVAENLPLTDQIRLFANAEDIVAPHGAGLFHSLFMPGGRVIEFFPVHPDRILVSSCWFRIVSAHEESGRTLSWVKMDSQVQMSGGNDFSQYRLIVEVKKLAEEIHR